MMADTVEIRLVDGPSGTARVSAELVAPGLAVHESHAGAGWTVTHVPSGKALVRGIPTEPQAHDVAGAMVRQLEGTRLAWDCDEQTIQADAEAYLHAAREAAASVGATDAIVGGRPVDHGGGHSAAPEQERQ